VTVIKPRQDDPVLDAVPTPTVLLDADLTICAVNPAYARAVRRTAEELLGRAMFEAFPDNPGDPDADGVANLSRSLESVARSRRPHHMLVQRYDIVDGADGSWVPKVWQPHNSPVLDGGTVVGLLHQVHDITLSGEDVQRVLTGYRDLVRGDPPADADSRRLADELEAVAAMLARHRELGEQVLQLRRAMTSRATIEQAKGMIMADRRCTADEAFEVLARLSSTTHVKVADVALAFVYQAQTRRR
jgi:hypothetical protein